MANYEVLEPGGHAALIDGLKDYTDREGGVGAEQIADGSVNLDKLGDDVLDELDTKADIDGYYAQLTAGAADNLTGRGDATAAEFLYRTAGGTADIETGQAVAKSVKGNTLVWNQLVRNPADGTNWSLASGTCFTKTVNQDNSVTLTIADNSSTQGVLRARAGANFVSGHKYLVKVGASGLSTLTRLNLLDDWNGRGSSTDAIGSTSAIITATLTSSTYPYAAITIQRGNMAVGDTITIKSFTCFDLTAMFGAGKEPSTVAEFEALFPEPYYEYDAGSLLSVNMEGIETVGFNQWDEEWESGGFTENGEKTAHANQIRSKNFIPVFPSTEYYLKCDTNLPACVPYFYDSSKGFISSPSSGVKNATFTTPNGCHYLKFKRGSNNSPVTTYSGDICINLSWSGRRNGEYEPFWSSQRLIDVATYFPDGMRSAGSIYDELTSIEAITRVGVVDLGTLTWIPEGAWQQSKGLTRLFATISDAATANSENVTASGYFEPNLTIVASTMNSAYCIALLNGRVYVTMPYPDISTASDFTAWLQSHPVTIHYALATPVVTPIDPPLNLSYRVDDFGTERIMATGEEAPQSAPPTLEIAYGLNAVDFIRRAPTQYISHDSHDNFVDALEAEMGVTITETFDETDNAYEYSIVPDDGMTLAQAKENLRGLLDLVQGTIGSVTNWSEIVSMASHGSSFLVGTQFQTKYKSAADGTEYDMPWDVMHFETATIRGGGTVSGAYLESHYTLPFATMFDQIEAFYAVPSGGLAAGTYSITFGNTSAWGQVPANSTYHFTLANSYSSGAQLCFNRSIYNYAPDTCTVQAFATQGATTAAETVSVASGASGTSLGTIGTAQVTDASDLNHLHRVGLGSGRWMTSAIRQWLNSDADGGQWWVPQTKWDRPPSYASYDGFLKGVDADLVAAMREIRVVTAQSYYADGGTAASPATDVTYDKVFLPSWEQQYLAVSQSYGGSAGLEGGAWDYWRQAAGTASPRPASGSDTSTYTPAYIRYAMENHTTARFSWLRSAYRSYGSYAAVVYSSGLCGSSHAGYGSFAAPACFIG